MDLLKCNKHCNDIAFINGGERVWLELFTTFKFLCCSVLFIFLFRIYVEIFFAFRKKNKKLEPRCATFSGLCE